MTQSKPDVFLMYRRPERDEHEKLTDVLDDILNRLEIIEDKISKINNQK